LLSEDEPVFEVLLIINGLQKRFMRSDLFRFELLSEHEPCWGEVSGSRRQPLQRDGRAVAALYERR